MFFCFLLIMFFGQQFSYTVLLRPLACPPSPFLTVRCCQSEAQPSFLNFKGQTALRVIGGLAAALRVLCRKCHQPLFEIGVVGIGEAQTNVALTFCAFIIDNGEVFYLDGGVTLTEATQKSHDDLSPKSE